MIQVNDQISLSEEEIQEKFIRSSGPGGQNVNKVATAVQLRFDAVNSPNLPGWVKARLIKFAGSRATLQGEVLIECDSHRTRELNRAEALERLVELIRKAATLPRKRVKTRPTLASKARRVKAKKERGEVKRGRGRVSRED